MGMPGVFVSSGGVVHFNRAPGVRLHPLLIQLLREIGQVGAKISGQAVVLCPNHHMDRPGAIHYLHINARASRVLQLDCYVLRWSAGRRRGRAVRRHVLPGRSRWGHGLLRGCDRGVEAGAGGRNGSGRYLRVRRSK